jgi:hypothetical protein
MDTPTLPSIPNSTGVSVPGVQSGATDAGSIDPNSVPGLLNIANQQGGAVAQNANALANPNSSILSTMSNLGKNTFSDFTKAISAPSEVVAGLIAGAKGQGSIISAIKTGEDPYTAIFGSTFNPDESIMEKIGGFVVRTATDILTDPTTYIGEPPWAMLAKDSVPLFGDAAKAMDIEAGEKALVNAKGQQITKGLRSFQNFYQKNLLAMGHEQALGSAMGKFMQTGNSIFNPAGKDLEELLKNTLDVTQESLQGKQFVNKSISDLLTQHPALIDTLMDKGGFKVLGNTVIKGASIKNALNMIPGYTTIDRATQPVRNMLRALFDPAMVKVQGVYKKVPAFTMDIYGTMMSTLAGNNSAAKQTMYDFAKGHDMNEDEVKNLSDALVNQRVPAKGVVWKTATGSTVQGSDRMAKLYYDAKGTNEAEAEALMKAGIPFSKDPNFDQPHTWVPEKTNIPKSANFRTVSSAKTSASMHADISRFTERGHGVMGTGENAEEQLPKEIEALKGIKGGETTNENPGLIDKIRASGSPKEASRVVGEHWNNRIKELTTGKDAMTFEKAMEHPDVTKMIDAQNALSSLPQNREMIGDPEKLGLTPQDDTGQTFIDQSGKVWNKSRASTDDLTAAGFKNFDPDWMMTTLSRQMENNKAIAFRAAWEDYATTGRVASEAPEGYVKIKAPEGINPQVKEMMEGSTRNGEPLFFHPAGAKLFTNFAGKVINDEPTNDILKAFDKIQGGWKASVTAIFAQFTGRNLLTHVANNMLDLAHHALDPAMNGLAADFVRKDMQLSGLTQKAFGVGEEALKAHSDLQDLLTKTMFTDGTGKDWSYGEIRQMIKNYGIAFGHDAGSTEDITLPMEDFAKSLKNQKSLIGTGKLNPFSQNFAPFAQGRHINSIFANHQRTLNFISNLKETGNVELAASRTKQFLFDYGALTNFEKTFMRRIMPFYTFTRKNLELQVRSLLTSPGRISAEVHSIQNIGDVMSGNAKLTAAENAALPDWIKTGSQILAKKNGENVTLMQGLPLPIEQPFSALQPNSILGSVSPLLRVPIEQASGWSFFQGKPLSDITNAAGYVHAPEVIKKAIGFTTINGKSSGGQPFTEYVALNPSVMNLFSNLPPTSRVMSSLKELQESGDNMDTINQKVMEQLLGAKYYSFDLTQEAQIQQNQLKKELQDMLDRAGVTATYSQSYIPPANPPAPTPKANPPYGQIAQAADLVF